MTELETMQRAKMYLDKLARGIDPFSNMELPQDSALNNIRLARCFFYVSGVLEQVIQNGGVVGARVRTRDFALPRELRGQVRLSSEPVRITAFVDALYQAVGDPDMKKLSVGRITEWLEGNGYMCKEQGVGWESTQSADRERPADWNSYGDAAVLQRRVSRCVL